MKAIIPTNSVLLGAEPFQSPITTHHIPPEAVRKTIRASQTVPQQQVVRCQCLNLIIRMHARPTKLYLLTFWHFLAGPDMFTPHPASALSSPRGMLEFCNPSINADLITYNAWIMKVARMLYATPQKPRSAERLDATTITPLTQLFCG